MPGSPIYPLSGKHLIDASAGTGKTYTISSLYVRLLLDREFSVKQILVVTYTKAATEDLRLRIRDMIKKCLSAFETGQSEESFFASLLERHKVDSVRVRQRLTSALHNFDEAAIFTIHGFCQRMLVEHSLESGALADTELVADLDDLFQEICADYWRITMQRFPLTFIRFSQNKLHPLRLFTFLKKIKSASFLPEIREEWLNSILDRAELDRLDRSCEDAVAMLCSAWQKMKEDVEPLFLKTEVLNRVSYKPEKRQGWLREMDFFCSEKVLQESDELFTFFGKFTSESLTKATKKKCDPPQHPFFEICQNVATIFEERTDLFKQCVWALQQEAAHYVNAEFWKRKAVKNVYDYDDLLLRLQNALLRQKNNEFSRLIRQKFPAALIDEFQDTDPVQYDIFTSIYRDGEETLLYFIGDPKQAIYSFRGADIFAYFKAIHYVPSLFHLEENYRSQPQLIEAVNAVFSKAGSPFVYDEIIFSPVKAAGVAERPVLSFAGQKKAPLQIWLAERQGEAKTKVIGKQEAEKAILPALSLEILRFIVLGAEQKAVIGKTPLQAKDIAVLVRTNREARLVQQALQQVGVASVVQSQEDVFASYEALEFARLLAAVADPGNEEKIKTALSTDFFAVTYHELAALNEEAADWDTWFSLFYLYHEFWTKKGFMNMLRTFFRKENIRSHVLCFVDGERKMTNYLHLAELLHRYESNNTASIAGVVGFLADKISDVDNGDDEQQLRLESDAERVQIVTVHRSKGLQYPVVFCPFAWQGIRADMDGHCSFHDIKTGEVVVDLGSPDLDKHKKYARQEALAENVRLLYVALTRAIHYCSFVWGPFKGADSSALAWLLHRRDESFSDMQKCFKKISDDDLRHELAELVSLSRGTIEIVPLATISSAETKEFEEEKELPVCREFTGTVPHDWQVSSFSGLTRQLHVAADSLGGVVKDERVLSSSTDSFFSFPKGAGPGTFLHDLLEHLDFEDAKKNPADQKEFIAEKLMLYGYENKWQDILVNMVQDVVQTPLLPDEPNLLLGNIVMDKRLNELEFYFPLSAGGVSDVRTLLSQKGLSQNLVDHFTSGLSQGFLKGFIDLIFEWQGKYYLVDWKSNYLGAVTKDYHVTKLGKVMMEELYVLQYLIYTVALHLFLASRIPDYSYEKCFGGVFYMFLRGVNREFGPEYGIFHDLPQGDFIESLTNALVVGQERNVTFTQ